MNPVHPPFVMMVHPLAFVLACYVPLSMAVPARNTACHTSKSISWTNCRIFGYNDTLDTVKPQCGYFTVPADYNNCAAGSVNLAVARRPAVVKPRLGTLFFNPGNVHTYVATFKDTAMLTIKRSGGPGGSGTETVLNEVADFHNTLGTYILWNVN